jgi:alpha-tubulin suppressor-like RCC1 family protein
MFWADHQHAEVPVPSPWIDKALRLPPKDPRCLVMPDGSVSCRGHNYYGEVGDGTTFHRNAYVPVVGLTDVTAVATENDHACALVADGAVYCWGYGPALGVGEAGCVRDARSPPPLPSTCPPDSSLPRKVPLPGPAKLVVAGDSFSTCAVLEDGTPYCWGSNLKGELGDGTTDDRILPTQVVGLEKVRSLAMGFSFTCAVVEEGSVWCWGDNNFGALGNGAPGYANSSVPVRVKLEGEDGGGG